MKTIILLALLVLVWADSDDIYHQNESFKGRQFERHVVGKNGHLKFFSGEALGNFEDLSSDAIHAAFKDLLDLQGTEEFVVKRNEQDVKGNQHIVFQQYNQKLEVDGGELILHLTPSNDAFAVTSSVLADTLESKPAASAFESLANVIQEDVVLSFYADQITVEVVPTLCYLLLNDEGFLVYRTQVAYVDTKEANITKRTKLYVDAATGHLLFNSPLWMDARNRAVYNANSRTSLPGTLTRSEGGAKSNDQMVNAAYDNSGICYDFYKATFNRDSIDNRGGKLISTVHYSSKYNNAFWDGTQMVYGDGDGVIFYDFAGDLSVVCHELTHAVTTYTANLRYSQESGALNEGMSDIMGAASCVYRDGGITGTTWLLGHDCYLDGDALRYMNNPILDGSSYDWYPTRYKGTSDNGGVHWNSGIANLAFVLMTQGGVHPQQKSTNWVEEIGIQKSQQIMYSALVNYMTASTTFAQARAATETAAKALYTTTEVTTVSAAWKAVGVGN